MDGTYPVDMTDSAAALLRGAQRNEYEEHGTVYPAFADIAQKEGFPLIAASFRQIAAIEKTHGDRFGSLADLLEQEKLFAGGEGQGWLCLNCGHIHQGPAAPAACPDAETTTAPAPQERTPEPEYAPELGEAVEADDAILGLISSTMEAFRQGR